MRALSIAAGMRAACACAFPVLLGEITHIPSFNWVAIIGFWACIVDPGGNGRDRVVAMGGFAVLATLASFLGALIEPVWWLAVTAVFLWAFAVNMGRIFGSAAAQSGLLSTLAILVAVATPGGGLDAAVTLAIAAFVGGIWAMLLALVIWRLYPYGPARHATSQAWQEVAGFAAAIGRLYRGSVPAERWSEIARERRRATREAIDQARDVLVATRRSRAGRSERALQLLALVTEADQIFVSLIALSELLELNGAQPSGLKVERAVRHVLGRLSVRADGVAQIVSGTMPTGIRDVGTAMEVLRRRIGIAGDNPVHLQVASLLDRIDQWIDAAYLSLAGTTHEGSLAAPPEGHATEVKLTLADAISRIRGNLGFRSLAFSHALRVAVTGAIAVLITHFAHLPRGYWISITAVAVLQPYMVDTWRRTLERVFATILGGLIAAVILYFVHDPLLLTALIFPLCVAAMAVRLINFALFILCLTPQFILVAELFQTGGTLTGGNLAGIRALDTVIGGVLGLLAGLVLWPNWQGPRLPAEIATAIRIHRDYLKAALCFVPGKSAALDRVRREAGLSSNNAEASMQRLLSERHLKRAEIIEPVMTILAALRRLAGLAATISLIKENMEDSEITAATEDIAAWIEADLSALASSVETRASPQALGPAPLPSFSEEYRFSVLENEQGRIRQQIELLHAATERLAHSPVRSLAPMSQPTNA
ncbi:FUSC family protein [Faunimonas pinastri]|nr:FUSC family protein [Faunimonas pinastri]